MFDGIAEHEVAEREIAERDRSFLFFIFPSQVSHLYPPHLYHLPGTALAVLLVKSGLCLGITTPEMTFV